MSGIQEIPEVLRKSGEECTLRSDPDGGLQIVFSASFSEEVRRCIGRTREVEEGPIRSIELYNRGYFVLHGSCVQMQDGAVSIVGFSGAGKSTLAAYLCCQGAQLVSDGMTGVNPTSREVAVGPPRIKLDDDAIRLLAEKPGEFSRLYEDSRKRYFPVASVGPDSSAPLKLIVILEDGNDIGISPVGGANSLMKLLANIYLGEYLPHEHFAVVMRRAATLLQSGVQVKALRRRKLPSELPRIVEWIENAVRELR